MNIVLSALTCPILWTYPLVSTAEGISPIHDIRGVHLASVRQFTFGGENAEVYSSADGKKLVCCSTRNAKGGHEFNIFIADWRD